MLLAGAKESFDGYKNYRLDIGPGKIKFVVAGDEQTIETTEPAGYEADADGIRETGYQGPDCP